MLEVQARLLHTGNWGPDCSWEFWLSKELPPAELCTAVGCVAINNLSRQEVVMTHNDRGLEILAGHVEPGEGLVKTAARESLEEGGFAISYLKCFGWRKISNTPAADTTSQKRSYPPLAYNVFFWAYTESVLQAPTGKEVTGREVLSLPKIKERVINGEVDHGEYLIIAEGLKDCYADPVLSRYYGGSNAT